jgi:copper(I)-binding protein
MCPEPEEARAVIRSSHGSKLLRRLLIGATALLIPVLAGCEAGNNAPTLQYHPAANGAYSTTDSISIINAFVLGGQNATGSLPAGASASMFVGFYNGGSQADKLVSVSAPGTAASVQVVGGPIALPGQQATYLTGPAPKLILKQLSQPLAGGQAISMVFTFANGGTVTLQVPVEPQSGDYATYSPPAAPVSPPATSKVHPKTSASGAATPSAGAQPSASVTASPTPTK